MKKEFGQVVILLLLIMVVALAIGLSTIGRSILEVSTSRKSEDSSRAFSAAEAGIERAIKQNEDFIGTANPVGAVNTLNNQAGATILAGGINTSTNALGFINVTKRDFAQFWLASPSTSDKFYTGTSFDIYFGDPDIDGTKYDKNVPEKRANQPAIEVNIIYWDGSKYQTYRRYYDSRKDTSGTPTPDPRLDNNPSGNNVCNVYSPAAIATNDNVLTNYYCKVTVFGFPNSGSSFPLMVRVRLLYTDLAHPIALKPAPGLSLPPQANIYNSSGTSGDVKRTLEVTNYRSVMPQFFDYVLFSANDLIKN